MEWKTRHFMVIKEPTNDISEDKNYLDERFQSIRE